MGKSQSERKKKRARQEQERIGEREDKRRESVPVKSNQDGDQGLSSESVDEFSSFIKKI